MSCEKPERLFLITPVFKNLTWKLYKIPLHSSSCYTRLCSICQHAVKRVTKVVKKSGHFIKGEQRRFSSSRFREIANYRDVRSFIFAILLLLILVGCHP